jgi:sensor histidine kinase YesM
MVDVSSGPPKPAVSRKASEPKSFLSRLSLFWKLHIAGCLLLFLALFPLRLFLISYETALLGSIKRHAIYLLFCDLTCFALAIGLRYFYRLEYFCRISRIALTLNIIGISAALAIIDIGLTFPVFSLAERLKHHASPHLYIASSLWPRFWFFCTWSLLYFLLRAFQDARRADASLKVAENRRREAELLMLRSQINPHFLFNALNTVLSESNGNERLTLVVRGLSDYMRYALANRSNLFVSLGQEAEALARYADVEQARFEGGLSIKVDIAPSTLELPVPGVFMQPLVENAIKYGRESCEDVLQILVQTQLEKRTLHIKVSNSGAWFDSSNLLYSDRPSGAGLAILKRQLELLYPGRSQFHIGPQNGHVVAEILIDDPVAAANEARSKLRYTP